MSSLSRTYPPGVRVVDGFPIPAGGSGPYPPGEEPLIRPELGSGLLPREISGLIFEDARESSAVQQLARRVPLTLAGKTIPYLDGRPQAAWVTEGGRKPVSTASLGTLTMDPKKLAVIVPFSDEYLDSETVDLFDELRPMIAEAFGYGFDLAALFGVASPFTAHLGETDTWVELGTGASSYVDLVQVMTGVVEAGYRLRGWAYSPVGEVRLLGDVDSTGRPILTTVGEASFANRLLNRPAAQSEAVDYEYEGKRTLAVGADWSKVAYGAIGEIEYDISEEASLELSDGTMIHLWQDNMVALRAEAYYGYQQRDEAAAGFLYEAASAG
jgi:HK97 family phage major capsid protein